MNQALIFDLQLIKRYDKAGPRYTSYPTAVQFHDGFGEQDYIAAAARTNEEDHLRPLSLYFHIPFCDTVCFYCGCNKVVTKRREKAIPYLDHLYKEIEKQGALFDRQRSVVQLHWGGGTPTFLSHEQMQQLMAVTRQHFSLADDDTGEFSIEIDPREVDSTSIKVLRDIGFNRLSIGVQDFDPRVQKAVNRLQSEKQTLAVLNDARRLGFSSINMDLIYGLPFQSEASFGETLEKVIAADPDRLSIFNYAHMPELFKPQRRIDAQDLPSPQEKLNILQMTIERLTAAGYVYIGMDHFAKPDDELTVAQRKHTLYRNFQGYSTHADCDLIAMGNTSISMIGNVYGQNVKTLDDYYSTIEKGSLPIFRGIALNSDDIVRRDVITRLICHFDLDMSLIEESYQIDFKRYFKQELADLKQMEQDGLVVLNDKMILVQPCGRLLIRNICMVFDRYLRSDQTARYSKVI